jgi:hypothetical protein
MLKKIDWYKVVGLCLLAWIGLSMAMIKEDGLRVREGKGWSANTWRTYSR